MKNYSIKPKHKKWHDNRSEKIGSKPRRNIKYDPNKNPIYYRNYTVEYVQAIPVVAPSDICLFSETDASG